MTDIGKYDDSKGDKALDYPASHPAVAAWCEPETGFLRRVRERLARTGAHAGRTVVLLPYAQLRPLAARLWAQTFPDGFAPRFETTMSWSKVLGAHVTEPTDIRFDMALDALSAHELLTRAGLGPHANALVGSLMQAVLQLAPMAAAQGPAGRAAWAQRARQAVMVEAADEALKFETAVARIAMEWAAASGYASDVLFDAHLVSRTDCLVMAQGLLPDPMALGLAQVWADKLVVMPLVANVPAASGSLATHPCDGAEDEAQRTAACAIAHIEAGRYPLALVSSDRALTRRVRAMLDGAGVQMRDENGWKLSTSSAAGTLMAALKACSWNPSADAVLAWLKVAPIFSAAVDPLEAALRRDQVRDWHRASTSQAVQKRADTQALCLQVDALRGGWQGRHNVAHWLVRLRQLLEDCGLLAALQGDGAGVQVLSALRLHPHEAAQWDLLASDAIWSQRRMDLADFTRWVSDALEASNFQPEYPQREEVVIVPMSQMLARPFAAVVLAGCDEVRLNPSPEPAGGWTPAQRLGLGLPTREVAEQALRAAWRHALQTPACDVLWRTADEAGEALLPSALVQLLLWESAHRPETHDPRSDRLLNRTPVLRPLPQGAALPLRYWTQGAYEDLRQCPYRFFAMRQLGLRSVDELESEVDKRDFGLWLHEVLQRFHATLSSAAEQDHASRLSLLDQAAQRTTDAMGLPDGEFLPFAASWPAVREGYLDWLLDHEAHGMRFSSGETAREHTVGGLTLKGRVDRIDLAADGQTLVLDYKTENIAKTRSRTKDPFEDTQIAFYAALFPNDTLRGAYVNVSELGGTKTVEQKDLVQARDALIEGMLGDWERIAHGAALPALGDGAACDFCQARGLCRKDFWDAT